MNKAHQKTRKYVPKLKTTINKCPDCKTGKYIKMVNIVGGRRLPNWWFVECDNCHWCGKTKLGAKRAIKWWNRHNKEGNK